MSKSADDPLNGLPRPIILGSSSAMRKRVLKEMGIEYHVIVPPMGQKKLAYNATIDPEESAKYIADAKMQELVKAMTTGRCDKILPPHEKGREWLLMTADKVLTCNGRILGNVLLL
jgi:predicted house-cleaning NTP pyrophosphatase (Maf/HAM1 superfamily)